MFERILAGIRSLSLDRKVELGAAVVVASFTVILAATSIAQWRRTGDQIRVAEDANKLSASIFASGEKAWLFIAEHRSTRLAGNVPLDVELGWQNMGRSPAINVHPECKGVVVPTISTVVPDFPAATGPGSAHGPGEIFPVAVEIDGASESDSTALTAGTKRVVVFCFVQYEDVFGAYRWTRACLWWQPNGNRWLRCAEHNDAG